MKKKLRSEKEEDGREGDYRRRRKRTGRRRRRKQADTIKNMKILKKVYEDIVPDPDNHEI